MGSSSTEVLPNATALREEQAPLQSPRKAVASIPSGPLLGLWGPSVSVPSGLGWWPPTGPPTSPPHPWWSSGQDSALSLPRPGFDSQPGKGVPAATAGPSLFLGGCTALKQLLGFSTGFGSSHTQCVGLGQGWMNFGGWQHPPVPPLPSGCVLPGEKYPRWRAATSL